MKPGSDCPTIETLAAVIAHSQIVVAQPHSPTLPAGFEDLDIALLDWITAERRRVSRRLCGCRPGGSRVAAHSRRAGARLRLFRG